MTQEKVEQVSLLWQYKEFLFVFLGVISTYFYYLKNKKNDELLQIKEKLSDKKYNLYNDVYSLFFDLMKAEKLEKKNKSQKTQLELAYKLIEVKKQMFIYAPDHIVLSFLNWDKNSKKENVDFQINMMEYFRMLELIRKDMGNENTCITAEDILESILISEKEISKFSQ